MLPIGGLQHEAGRRDGKVLQFLRAEALREVRNHHAREQQRVGRLWTQHRLSAVPLSLLHADVRRGTVQSALTINTRRIQTAVKERTPACGARCCALPVLLTSRSTCSSSF